jgi:hypothetical protein
MNVRSQLNDNYVMCLHMYFFGINNWLENQLLACLILYNTCIINLIPPFYEFNDLFETCSLTFEVIDADNVIVILN